MKFSVVKRLAPAVLALGIAVSGVGLTAGTAFASSSAAAKAGAACSKAEKGKTEKAGKAELVCKKTSRASTSGRRSNSSLTASGGDRTESSGFTAGRSSQLALGEGQALWSLGSPADWFSLRGLAARATRRDSGGSGLASAGQPDHHSGAWLSIFDPDFAAVRRDDLPDYGQSQAGACALVRTGRVEAHKTFEYALSLEPRDARAVVRHQSGGRTLPVWAVANSTRCGHSVAHYPTNWPRRGPAVLRHLARARR